MTFNCTEKQSGRVRSLLFAVVITEDRIAVGRPARMSSVEWVGTADKAVGGDTKGDFNTSRSHAHTLSNN